MGLRIGSSAFTAAGWSGSLYPKGLAERESLSYYPTKFDTRDKGEKQIPPSFAEATAERRDDDFTGRDEDPPLHKLQGRGTRKTNVRKNQHPENQQPENQRPENQRSENQERGAIEAVLHVMKLSVG
jgi:hypothetical protein